MSLFALYSRDSIPANRNHILTFDKVKHWPHLQILKNKLSPPLNCPIGLIIGYDNASVFAPLRCVPSVNFGPYSQLTWLGWSVVGCVNPSYKSGTTPSQCMLAYEVFNKVGLIPDHKSPFCFKTNVQESLTPLGMTKVLEQDFNDCNNKLDSYSIEDTRFL